MKDEDVVALIKRELDKYCPFTIGGYTYVANKIFNEIKSMIEEEKRSENKRLKRVVIYRILSMISEALIVYMVTCKWEFSLIITLMCLIVHTCLHWLVDKIIW